MAEVAEKPKQAEGGKEMEIQRARPAGMLSPFGDMERQMDRLFESVLPHGWLRPLSWERPLRAEMEAWVPSVDVVDREDEFVVRAQIPNVDKKDLNVSMSDSSVTIKGQTRREEKEEKGDYYRCEISRGSFSRTVLLPAPGDASKAEADYKDGLLTLKIPKVEGAKRRNIKIK